ncbi:DNA internalization-related competence protein ComEC/Rec2 [Intestinimonas sp.]|uniref:DNA internalization-related competence protein ComEC/Rec2 n=1 Tax=Intestinimonas sp. TaxID=1965293 RepID=UPI002639A977|nr:DNA internalization-related competence protein ComEC/Rec2 [Intestinimonas sp.]
MRKLAAVAVGFAAAVFLACQGLWAPALLLPLPVLLKREDRWRRCALVCLGVAAGLAWTAGYNAHFLGAARELDGTGSARSAAVIDWPYETAYGAGVEVRVDTENGPVLRAILYGDGEELLDLRPGDALTVTADWKGPPERLTEGWERRLARGVHLTGDVRKLEAERPERLPLWARPAHWAQAVKGAVAAAFPAESAGLVTALLTGDTAGLPQGDYDALRRVGLAHAVAVSGLHMGFLVQLAVALTGSRYRRRTAFVVLPLMAVYALAVGCTPSVVRAAVMNGLLLLGPLLGRENDSPTSLSLALLLLLLQDPYASLSVGLQLSFASVAGILAFSGRVRDYVTGLVPAPEKKEKRPGPLRRLGRWAAGSLGVTVGAMVFTVPLLVWYFGSLSLAAPLANLLCLPLLQLTFQGGLLTALVQLLLPALGTALGQAVGVLPRLALWVVRGLADAPFAAVTVAGPYLLGGLAVVYLLWVLFLTMKGPRRPLTPLCCSVLVLTAALVLNHAAYRAGALTMTVLDVGQGQCVVLRCGDRVAVVDCGSTGGDAGDLAAGYLSTMGIERVDLLVLTHCHSDHANGVSTLLDRLEVSNLALPKVIEAPELQTELLAQASGRGVPAMLVWNDVVLDFGNAALTLYGPLGSGDTNEEGLSLLCETDNFAALITGDMDQVVEGRLVKYGQLPDVDVLLAGHHGSKYAASELLLETVTPETAVISCGYNTYGHPAPETLLRLSTAGCDIYRTDLQGNVTITVR